MKNIISNIILGLKIKFKRKNITKILNNIETERNFYYAELNAFKNADKELQHYIVDNNLYDNVPKLIPHLAKDTRIEINLADHCNLNCKFCDHFSPIAEKHFLDIETFERDMKRLSELTNGELGGLSLIGGEPLLNKDICKFFEISRKYFPNTIIDTVTNGILLKKYDAVWNAIKKNNIKLLVTTYPINVDYEFFDQKARKMKIQYQRFYMYETDLKEKISVHHPFKIDGSVNKDDFIHCYHFNKCITLKEGKLYTCPIIPNSVHFSKYFDKNLEITNKDFIDIYKVESFSEIAEFLAKRPPFCGYCDVTKRTGHPYGLSKKAIEEWT